MQLPRKMSANVMASISRTLGNRHDGNTKHSNEIKLAGEESKDKLYEPKHRQKVVRVLTVVAYVVSVSLAAIILSLYYTFIWDPKDHALHTKATSLNSTSKLECENRTYLVVAASASDGARKINGSHIARVAAMPLIVVNDTRDSQKSEENLSGQLSVEISQDSSKENVETSTESAGIGRLCPWTKILKEVNKND